MAAEYPAHRREVAKDSPLEDGQELPPEFAKEYLGVDYVLVPPRLPTGTDTVTGLMTRATGPYLTILHSQEMARFEPPSSYTLELYDELFQILDKFDTHHVGKMFGLQLSDSEHREILENLDGCFHEMKTWEKKLDLAQRHRTSSTWHVRVLARSYERMLKFLTNLRMTLWKRQANEKIFRQLFIDFTWIFGLVLCGTNIYSPLMVRDMPIITAPHLVYEDLPEPGSMRTKILVTTFGEARGLDLNTTGLPGGDIDPVVLPDKLQGQHACQLVQVLPETCLRNKECVLGFIVQGTKVRLTCLKMSEEHRRSLELADVNPWKYDQSKIYYTRAYDIFNSSDRHHLVYILATVSSVAKFNRVEFKEQ